jgi:hypothetical protein
MKGIKQYNEQVDKFRVWFKEAKGQHDIDMAQRDAEMNGAETEHVNIEEDGGYEY